MRHKYKISLQYAGKNDIEIFSAGWQIKTTSNQKKNIHLMFLRIALQKNWLLPKLILVLTSLSVRRATGHSAGGGGG